MDWRAFTAVWGTPFGAISATGVALWVGGGIAMPVAIFLTIIGIVGLFTLSFLATAAYRIQHRILISPPTEVTRFWAVLEGVARRVGLG